MSGAAWARWLGIILILIDLWIVSLPNPSMLRVAALTREGTPGW
jgi:hypothetical protein